MTGLLSIGMLDVQTNLVKILDLVGIMTRNLKQQMPISQEIILRKGLFVTFSLWML